MFTVQIISLQSFSLFFIENIVNFKVFTCIYAVLFTFVHNGASYIYLYDTGSNIFEMQRFKNHCVIRIFLYLLMDIENTIMSV